MIELEGLTKRYGDKLEVDGLTFTVGPGVVTGFLGPNGAGKSTTMRIVLGLDHPTAAGPWGGLGIMALRVIAALAGGYVLLKRRDAQDA